MSEIFNSYHVGQNIWDEMYSDSTVRQQYSSIYDYLKAIPQSTLDGKEELAKKLFMSQGITFTVYDSGEGIEKIFPFDIIPRIITSTEWSFKIGRAHV